MEYYIELGAAIVLAFAVAYGIICWIEAPKCNRKQGGYPCHGENCEGCYRVIGGQVVYEYEQPLNDWGKAALVAWPVGADTAKTMPSKREMRKYYGRK